MNILVIIIAIAAIALLITGGIVPTLNFLLWVGLVLLVIAAIVFLVRYPRGAAHLAPAFGSAPAFAIRMSHPAVRPTGRAPRPPTE